ncbi:MAG: hypothetical protein M1812_003596 [Candelaria pacifica]|nr:MAG: hypothetical protein M1812_003596 [Candelaria pacifica]
MQLPLFNSSGHSGDGQLRRTRNPRLDMRSLFTGTSGVRSSPDSASPSGRKAPRLGFQAIPQARLNSPHLHRSARPTRTFSATASNGHSSRPRTENRSHSSPAIPAQAHANSTRSYIGFGPEDQHLAALAQEGRRQRDRRRLNRDRGKTRSRCFPSIRHPRVRRKFFNTLISGAVLATILSIYLAIAIGHPLTSQPFHILLILLILSIAVFFCHSLIRLCMFTLHPPSPPSHNHIRRIPDMIGPGGFAAPETPIRVILARDEEAVLGDEMKIECPPPAYGLWRESVKLDPNMLHWQRNIHPALRNAGSESSPLSSSAVEQSRSALQANRPPSYISEDGVQYAVGADQRSLVPTFEEREVRQRSEMERVRVGWLPIG